MDVPPHLWAGRVRNGDGDSLVHAQSIWQCLVCFCCVARCPRGVRPVELAEQARSATLRKKIHTASPTDLTGNKPIPQQLIVAAMRKKRA